MVEQNEVEILSNDDAEWIVEEAANFVLKIEAILAERRKWYNIDRLEHAFLPIKKFIKNYLALP